MNISKKIKIGFLCLIFTLSLSACSLPFFGKKNEEAKKQNDPDQIFSLMLSKMDNDLKTADYNALFDIKIDVDTSKLSISEKQIMSDKLLSFGVDRPYVLGIDNIENEQKLSMAAPKSPLFSKDKIKVGLEYSIDGKIDQSDKENIKGESKMKMDIDYSNIILRFDFESKVLGEDIYFKINQIPAPLLDVFSSELEGRWWNLNLAEIEEEQGEMEKYLGANSAFSLGLQIDEERNKEIQQELEAMMKKHNLFEVTEVLTEKNIDGRQCHHYKIDFNRKAVADFIDELYDFLIKNTEKSLEDVKNNIEADKSINSYPFDTALTINDEMKDKIRNGLKELVKIFKKSDMEVWIDKEDHFLRKAKYDFAVDFKDVDIEEIDERIKDAFEIKINGEMKYSNINQDLNIEAPIKYESIFSYLTDRLKEERMKARDARRLSDIKQTQTALELYYINKGAYPDNLEQLSEGQVVYFSNLPENPKPNDNDCAEDFEYDYQVSADKKDYKLEYCLGNKTANVPAGYNTASSRSIYEKEEKESVLNLKLDTDLDGLFDWEEIEIYGTNPFASDTDGDGFLDGNEVKNGYNPNGPGKLPIEILNKIWKDYQSDDFSIRYPSLWELDDKFLELTEEEKAVSGILLQLLSPYDGDKDRFRENILISLTDISDSSLKTIDEWNDYFSEKTELNIISSKKINFAGREAIDFEYYKNSDNEADEVKIKMREIYFIKDNKRYSLLFSGEAFKSDDEKINHEEVAEKIISTFELLK